MALRVVFLGRARREVNAIVAWLAARSISGASRWIQALESTMKNLEIKAPSCAWAQEEELQALGIREILFKTRRGRPFSALFTVVEDEVRILHIRGPGQAPLSADDLPTG